MNNESLLSEFNQSPYYRIETEIALCNGCQSENRNLCRILTVSRNVPYVKNRLRNDRILSTGNHEIMDSIIVRTVFDMTDSTGNGRGRHHCHIPPDETGHIFPHDPCQPREPGIPVSDGHETVRIASKKKRMPAMRVTTGNHKRGGCKWNGAFRVGRYCRHGGKAIPASWIVISSQTKQNWVRYDMFANVHGWIVRPRFRTVCGTMRQNSVRHALKSRVAHGYCIGCAECWRWHVRAGVRYVGMGWCWQHARDEICDATMIAVSSGGTYRTGTCRRHARLHRFTSKLRLISKKMRRCHCCTVFSFFTRVTQLAKNHSWSAKRNAGNGDLHMVRSCCGNLYENESILSYLYVHIGSNGVIETWVRWVLPFGLSKKCKH